MRYCHGYSLEELGAIYDLESVLGEIESKIRCSCGAWIGFCDKSYNVYIIKEADLNLAGTYNRFPFLDYRCVKCQEKMKNETFRFQTL